LHRRDDTRVAVPDRSHRDSSAEIEIAFAVLIPYLAAFPARQTQLKPAIGRDDEAVVKLAGGNIGMHFRRARTLIIDPRIAALKLVKFRRLQPTIGPVLSPPTVGIAPHLLF